MVGALPALHPFSPLLLMLEGVEHTLPVHFIPELSLFGLLPCMKGLLHLRKASVYSSIDSLFHWKCEGKLRSSRLQAI
jgi:hypothetical protein